MEERAGLWLWCRPSPLLSLFTQVPSETVRKVSEVPVEKPCRVPRSSFLADFVLLMPASFTVGALLIPLFGQFRRGVLGSS
jgi:hypothetical protein